MKEDQLTLKAMIITLMKWKLLNPPGGILILCLEQIQRNKNALEQVASLHNIGEFYLYLTGW